MSVAPHDDDVVPAAAAAGFIICHHEATTAADTLLSLSLFSWLFGRGASVTPAEGCEKRLFEGRRVPRMTPARDTCT